MISQLPEQSASRSPMTLASSSVRVLLRYVFFTRSVCPEGKVQPVLGMGGSPSFCCSLSAMTRNALRPIFILCTEKKLQVQMFVINFQYCTVNPPGQLKRHFVNMKSIPPAVTRSYIASAYFNCIISVNVECAPLG